MDASEGYATAAEAVSLIFLNLQAKGRTLEKESAVAGARR
jgi:hypothetical protein